MATYDSDVDIKKKIEVNLKVQPPKMYKVIYLNDEVTSIEFVVETLCAIFNYDVEGAQNIAMLIHEEGAATVAVLPYEIAEQKGVEVTVLARNNGFPLSIRLEPEA